MFLRFFSISHFSWLIVAIFFATQLQAKKPQLQVVTELSPPYQLLANNKVSGTVTTAVRKIIQTANLDASFQLYPWARAYKIAEKEPNTLIYSLAKTPERIELFHWLAPVVKFQFGLVALSENGAAKMTQLKDVANFVVAVQRYDVGHRWALKFGLEEGKQLIICPDISCSWDLLLKKKVDFIIESPELNESMLKLFKLPKSIAKYVVAIPDLDLMGYLAANKNIEPKILERLKLAIKNEPPVIR